MCGCQLIPNINVFRFRLNCPVVTERLFHTGGARTGSSATSSLRTCCVLVPQHMSCRLVIGEVGGRCRRHGWSHSAKYASARPNVKFRCMRLIFCLSIRDGQAALPCWFPRSDVQTIVNYIMYHVRCSLYVFSLFVLFCILFRVFGTIYIINKYNNWYTSIDLFKRSLKTFLFRQISRSAY